MSNKKSSNQPSTSINISFIIPALNEAAILFRLLDSIKGLNKTTHLHVHEIILVDAASTDGTVALARKNGCSIISTKAGHVSASRNLGAAQATGDILAFIDADCELPPNWLEVIAKEMQQDNIVAAGATMAINQINTTWVERAWFELAHQQRELTTTSDVDWLATFNLAVKKAAFDHIGGFDESLVTCEDVDFGYQLSSLGRLRLISSCGVIHHGESKTVHEFYKREAWRSRGAFRVISKHWKKPRELASFLLPTVVVIGLFISLITALTFLVQLYQGTADTTLLIVALASAPLPILLLTLRRRVKWPMLLPCGSLLSIYFCARFYGMLKPFSRVERVE